jgi:tetratricopeptide (TPR) repeat protein
MLGRAVVKEANVNDQANTATTELMALAERKDFDGVLATFREQPPAEVQAVADQLREDDIYNVAIELYKWLLEQGDSADAHFGIGQCYGKIYDYDAALTHLDQAFAADPERSDGASYYAYILERHGRMDDADRWYRQALEGAEADDLWARSHYAWFLEKWGRTDDAGRAYEDVLERNPAYTWAVKRYAAMLHGLGEEERAKSLLRDSAEQNPGNRFAALNYLEYLLLTEDDEYVAFRQSLDPPEGPPWYPVMLELYDYYREHLLPGRPDPDRLAAWEAQADALKDSVHRDFDDLTAKLEDQGGDVGTWKRQVQLLLK